MNVLYGAILLLIFNLTGTTAQMELLPHITWYHDLHLKRKLTRDDLEASGITKLILEVIAPEILTHMISLDMKIDYDDALIILNDPKARLYGEQLDTEEILALFTPTEVTEGMRGKRRHKRRQLN